jgi:hypothetical protein
MPIPLAFAFYSKNSTDIAYFKHFIKGNRHQTPIRFLLAENNKTIYAIKWTNKTLDEFIETELQRFIQDCMSKNVECEIEQATLEKTKEIYNLDNRIDAWHYGEKDSWVQFDWGQ